MSKQARQYLIYFAVFCAIGVAVQFFVGLLKSRADISAWVQGVVVVLFLAIAFVLGRITKANRSD